MLKNVSLGRDSTVLELGCGDGFQLGLLRQRFARVFAIDPANMPDQAGGCVYAVAEALPFEDETFDLIVSNCVLEHLNDRRRALDESVRVLKPGGFMTHVVPSRFWKVASLLLNPIGYPLRVAEKWRAMRAATRGGCNARVHRTRPHPTTDSEAGSGALGLPPHPRDLSGTLFRAQGLRAQVLGRIVCPSTAYPVIRRAACLRHAVWFPPVSAPSRAQVAGPARSGQLPGLCHTKNEPLMTCQADSLQ